MDYRSVSFKAFCGLAMLANHCLKRCRS